MSTSELTQTTRAVIVPQVTKKRETMNIGGQEYPIIGYVENEIYGIVPLIDIPMMSDEKWNQLAEANMKAYRRA